MRELPSGRAVERFQPAELTKRARTARSSFASKGDCSLGQKGDKFLDRKVRLVYAVGASAILTRLPLRISHTVLTVPAFLSIRLALMAASAQRLQVR